jgi:hypothetical protein
MNFRYLRIWAFYKLMRPFSERSRKRRMHSYLILVGVKQGMSVLDLGGQPMIWESVPFPLEVTILNKPGIAKIASASQHQFRYIEGDACNVVGFSAQSFDCVFSNSVIEHVGASDKQADFAREVRRLGKSYWVQTPSKWFPIEAHTGMPFWWFYPAKLRQRLIARWRQKLPAWTVMIEETSVVSKAELQQLFPEATILVENVFGIPKSYAAYYVVEQRRSERQRG